MAIYKVTERFDEGATLYIKFYGYTAIGPASTNTAGVLWRTVVAEMRAQKDDQRTFSMPPPPGISVAQLDAGEFHVWSHFVRLDKPVTGPQVVAAIEAEAEARETEMSTELMARLEYWGFTGDTG